jgi:hypothetical protein
MANVLKTKSPASFEQFMEDHGFITKSQLTRLQSIKTTELGDRAGDATPEEISHLLITQHLLDEEDVAKAKAAFLNLPYVDLRKLSGFARSAQHYSRRIAQFLRHDDPV